MAGAFFHGASPLVAGGLYPVSSSLKQRRLQLRVQRDELARPPLITGTRGLGGNVRQGNIKTFIQTEHAPSGNG